MATAVFPEDLGDSQTGHAVGFTSYKTSAPARSMGNLMGMAGGWYDPSIGQVVDWDAPQEIFDFMNSINLGKSLTPLSNITSPIDSVFLYVPAGGQAPMAWSQKHIYTDVKLSRALTNFLGVTKAAEVGSGLAGMAINPRIEVLYQTTDLRNFTFNFLMAPQSEKESEAMKSLIKIFRKNAAPTLGNRGYLFDAPNEWGIAFWRKENGGWVENTNIPKIRRSVLNSVEVMYPIPGGEWSTFSNGHPVSAMITLLFSELSIVDSKNIEEGY